jgi:hypothetical protein
MTTVCDECGATGLVEVAENLTGVQEPGTGEALWEGWEPRGEGLRPFDPRLPRVPRLCTLWAALTH